MRITVFAKGWDEMDPKMEKVVLAKYGDTQGGSSGCGTLSYARTCMNRIRMLMAPISWTTPSANSSRPRETSQW